jgi:hypothetical protein
MLNLDNDSFILDGQANTKYCQLDCHSMQILSAVKELNKRKKTAKTGQGSLNDDDGVEVE